ncbi:MAG: DUF748 domain-containing protein, partial [Desulfobulbaceae bacterium]|nr:DUF748 domain-containing protein [Desulfobulbaceae bacterium]
MSDHFGNIPIQSPESSTPKKKHPRKVGRKPAKTTPKGKKPSLIKAWTVLAIAVVIIACYSTLGFWGVPYYISNIFPEKFLKKTGMVLEPTTVTFNPFTFRFKMGAIRILSESGTPILSLHSLHADVAPVAVLQQDLVCNTVTINNFDLNIARELDGSYNFQQIFGEKKDNNPFEILSISDLPFLFSLNNISLVNGKIKFNDIPAGKIHTVEEIRLTLPSFSNIPFQTDQYLRPHFSAIVNGSPIELTGQAPVTKLGTLGKSGESVDDNQTTKLSLDIHGHDLTIYSGYLPFSLPMKFKKGTADGKLDFLFESQTTNKDKLSIVFELQISGAELTKKDETIIAVIPTARLNGSLQPISRTLHFDEIAIKEPSISSFGKSRQGNITEPNITEPIKKDKKPTDPNSDKATPYSLSIDQLLIDNGVVRFFPEKKSRKSTSTWGALQLSVKNYRSATGDIKNNNSGSFSLSGEKNGSPTNFSWQGTFSSTDKLTGSLVLEKIDSNKLLETFDSNHPFKLKGIADLKGQLILYSQKARSSSFVYKLVDTELSIEGFVLMNNEKSILTAPIVKLGPLSLTPEAINFGNILFEKGRAQFTYGQIPKYFTAFSSNKYRLQGVDFQGDVTFDSAKKPGVKLTLNNVSLKANELDSSRKAPNNLSVSGKTETGGIFKAKGNLTTVPFSVAINTGFRALPLNSVLRFFSSSPLLTDIQGSLSGKGVFELPAKSFAGELQLTNASRKGSQKNRFSWKKTVFHELDYTANPFHLGITSAAIDQARFSWEITNAGNGPMEYLSDFLIKYLQTGGKQAPGKPKVPVSPVDIGEISFSNSKINIYDRRQAPNWRAVVYDFAGSIKDIHSSTTANKSAFTFTGKLDESPFVLSGATDLFLQKGNGSFRFSLENYPLASFHKQLSSKTDIDTSKGELKLTLDCAWQAQKYISSGNLTLFDLEPVAPTSDVALPLALLTRPDGTLQLNFNISRTAPVAKTTLLDELHTTFQRQVIKGT